MEYYRPLPVSIKLIYNGIKIGAVCELVLAQSDTMKAQIFKQATKVIAILSLTACFFTHEVAAQNLIVNPGFDNGTTGWSTDCSMEIYTENVYGGVSSTNQVTEIDGERCFNQQVNVTLGATYYVTYKASRRQGGSTPASTGVNVTVTGVETGTEYINVNRTYNNVSWSYTDEVFSFTIALNSADTKVNVKFGNYLTAGTYGTIIDDVNVFTGSAGMLPLKFISFSGKIKDNAAVLNWTASNDDNSGKYFVIEKAVGENRFDSIGSVKANDARSAYIFTDKNASAGSNNYRIKAVNANGHTYSNVISLNNNTTASAKVYPNPAVTNIAVSLSSSSNTVADIQIFNLSGNLVMNKQVSINEGSNVFTLDITSLKAGNFFVKISDSKDVNFARSFCKR